jgi:hypothetical protein
MTTFATPQRDKIHRAIKAWLITLLGLISTAAGSQPLAEKSSAARTEIIFQSIHANYGDVPIGNMAWCYDEIPAIAFVEKAKVTRVRFDGTWEDVIQADRALGEGSLNAARSAAAKRRQHSGAKAGPADVPRTASLRIRHRRPCSAVRFVGRCKLRGRWCAWEVRGSCRQRPGPICAAG